MRNVGHREKLPRQQSPFANGAERPQSNRDQQHNRRHQQSGQHRDRPSITIQQDGQKANGHGHQSTQIVSPHVRVCQRPSCVETKTRHQQQQSSCPKPTQREKERPANNQQYRQYIRIVSVTFNFRLQPVTALGGDREREQDIHIIQHAAVRRHRLPVDRLGNQRPQPQPRGLPLGDGPLCQVKSPYQRKQREGTTPPTTSGHRY